MTLHLVAELAAKSLLISGAALVLLFALKRRSAAERSWVAHAALLSLLALPVASLALPRWRLLAPVSLPSSVAGGPAAGIDAAVIVMMLYGAAAGLLLLGTVISVVRLFWLQRSADVVTDAGWLTALARAQQRMNIRYGAALLVSGTVTSPLSWGLMRPTILLDPGVLARPASAEAIITHELAHVTHLDWLKLLMARVVTAVFWFNPLVWILARHCHQLREEAADDAVISADVPRTDYATLLVEAARHENRAVFFTAHGVAPGKDSLRRRVTRVLDRTSSRKVVSAPFALGGLACVALIASPLAAATLERVFVAAPAAAPTPTQTVRSQPVGSTAPQPAVTIAAAQSRERRPARTLRAAPQPQEAHESPAATLTEREAARALRADARSLRGALRSASPEPTASTFRAEGRDAETGQTLSFGGNMVRVEAPAAGTLSAEDE